MGCLHNVTEIITAEVSRRRAVITERRNAATVIQKHMRRNNAMTQIQRMKLEAVITEAAVVVQKEWRKHEAQSSFDQRKEELQAQKAQQMIRARQTLATRKLQKLFSRYLLPRYLARMMLMAPGLLEEEQAEGSPTED